MAEVRKGKVRVLEYCPKCAHGKQSRHGQEQLVARMTPVTAEDETPVEPVIESPVIAEEQTPEPEPVKSPVKSAKRETFSLFKKPRGGHAQA